MRVSLAHRPVAPNDYARCGQLIRVLAIARRLASARCNVTIAALAAEHSVSSRTIRRDLLALETAGWDISKVDVYATKAPDAQL